MLCFLYFLFKYLTIIILFSFRYKEGHAIRHWKDTQHWYSLDLTTQQIWDYVGDNYVHRLNQNQSKFDGKLGEMNSPCMSLQGDCGICECSEDLGINGALISSKVEAVCFFSSVVCLSKQHDSPLLIDLGLNLLGQIVLQPKPVRI